MRKIILTLDKVQYTGDSIGDDIYLEIAVRGKVYILEKSIKPGSTLEVNEEVTKLEASNGLIKENINIKITEKDLLFNDAGKFTGKIKIDPDSTSPQKFDFKVKVQEMRKTLRKSTAMFFITLVASRSERIPSLENPEWTGDFHDDPEQIILARMIFGEVRDTHLSDNVRTAVGWTARNRVEDSKNRWAKTYYSVILQKKQYSAFDSKNKNRPFVENPLFSGKGIDKRAWSKCYKIAGQILNRKILDPTNGANHYFDDSIAAPTWATKKNFIIKIDTINFYRR